MILEDILAQPQLDKDAVRHLLDHRARPGTSRAGHRRSRNRRWGAAWQSQHRRLLETSFGDAPYFRDALDLLLEAAGAGDRYLSSLNVRLIRAVNEHLGIRTSIVFSRELDLRGNRTERLLSLLQRLGASDYLSGPSASAYLDVALLNRNGIRVIYESYEYSP